MARCLVLGVGIRVVFRSTRERFTFALCCILGPSHSEGLTCFGACGKDFKGDSESCMQKNRKYKRKKVDKDIQKWEERNEEISKSSQ